MKPGAAGGADRPFPGVDADRREEEDDHRSRAAAAALSRVADAAAARARAMPRWIWSPTCWPAARTRGCTSGWSTTCRSRRTSPRSRTRRRCRRTSSIRPRRGRAHARGAAEGDRRGDREAAGASRRPTTRSQRAINQIEASFYSRMERVGGFGGKANQLNGYYTNTGDPDWFNEDLARYRALSPTDIQAAAQQFLPKDRRVELTVVPKPGGDSAVTGRGDSAPMTIGVCRSSRWCSLVGAAGRRAAGARPLEAAGSRPAAGAEAAVDPEAAALERPAGVDRRAARSAGGTGQPRRPERQRRRSGRQVRRRRA